MSTSQYQKHVQPLQQLHWKHHKWLNIVVICWCSPIPWHVFSVAERGGALSLECAGLFANWLPFASLLRSLAISAGSRRSSTLPTARAVAVFATKGFREEAAAHRLRDLPRRQLGEAPPVPLVVGTGRKRFRMESSRPEPLLRLDLPVRHPPEVKTLDVAAGRKRFRMESFRPEPSPPVNERRRVATAACPSVESGQGHAGVGLPRPGKLKEKAEAQRRHQVASLLSQSDQVERPPGRTRVETIKVSLPTRRQYLKVLWLLACWVMGLSSKALEGDTSLTLWEALVSSRLRRSRT